MNNPQLAAVLRSRSPDALAELLDVCGDRLFGHRRCLLRNRENAQIAVRDALLATIAQIAYLACGECLYSPARAECGSGGAFVFIGSAAGQGTLTSQRRAPGSGRCWVGILGDVRQPRSDPY